MQFGTRRGVLLALILASPAMLGWTTSAQALGGRFHTIPREVPAVDFRTGDVMYAPPIPYGEYAKDYAGTVHGWAGMATGAVHGLVGKVCGLCGKGGCGLCGGLGHLGRGLCGGCGGDGCGTCDGHGRNLCVDDGSGHGHGADGMVSLCGAPGCDGTGLKHRFGLGHGHGTGGLMHGHGGHGAGLCGPGMDCATPQGGPSAQVIPSTQGVVSGPCGACGGHGLLGGKACGGCGGKGLLSGKLCGGCGGKGLFGQACGSCGGSGHFGAGLCGGCGGKGLLGGPCGMCGGKGLMDGSNVCGACGGKGCGACGGLGKLHALAGHVAGLPHTLTGMLLHKGDIEYFTGPGGPVPLTPGYVPYVVPVRSPRDYFAFPPFSDRAQP